MDHYLTQFKIFHPDIEPGKNDDGDDCEGGNNYDGDDYDDNTTYLGCVLRHQ